ncbi:MAG: 50S ribosomal protein L35ae [archaeon GBS-70-058]|nr:50S ribosomal protein L35ae [Candidatus Culexarchaeum nevadense]
MEGVLLSMRRGGGGRQYLKQAIVKVGDDAVKIFNRLVGRKVVWIHPKTREKFIGKIVRLHGRNSGCVIVHFRKQPPFQSLGTKVQIV